MNSPNIKRNEKDQDSEKVEAYRQAVIDKFSMILS